MDVIFTLFWLAFGLALLVKGSDAFVEASAGIARNFKVPSLVIGMTIMAFGTSAPEVFIGVRSALDGTAALAMGNVIGSDIFNLIFIIGLAATVTPMKINFKAIARDYAVAILGPILLLLMMLYFDDVIPRIGGVLFLFVFFCYFFVVIKSVMKKRKHDSGTEVASEETADTLKKNVLFAVLGLGGIILGGELTVHHAVHIAELLGMSARVIGLTIVATGTSLPELMIVLIAIKQKENELAVGNIIGSSIFNIMFVLGLSGVISPLPIESGLILDLIFLLGVSLLFLIFVLTKRKLSRLEGFVLISSYLMYISYVIFCG